MATRMIPGNTESSSSQRLNSCKVSVIVPLHVSVLPTSFSFSSRKDYSYYTLFIYKPGALWRGLAPLLFTAPRSTANRLLECMFQQNPSSHSSATMTSTNINDEDQQQEQLEVSESTSSSKNSNNIKNDLLQRRSLRMATTCVFSPNRVIVLWMVPPTTVNPDRTFTSIVVRLENALLRLSTLTAWWATLGGGYFFCRRISYSLQLARQQRSLALLLGNVSMARQCSVNEAYNLLYCGQFKQAKRVLLELWNSCPDDNVTRNQCRAAWILRKRLKTTGRKLDRYIHPEERKEDPSLSNNSHQKHIAVNLVDDYQRIRLVG